MKNLILAIIFIFSFSIFAFAQTSNLPCPKIEVQGPPNLVQAGEVVTFTAKLDKKVADSNLEFEWTVSQGTIIDQQGKPEIRVMTTEEMAGSNLTATVKVKGIFESCNNEASETAVIQDIIEHCDFPDTYGKLPLSEEFERFGSFMYMLTNTPDSRIQILFEIEKIEKLKDVKNRISKIFKFIESQNISRDLILFDICYAEKNQTTLRILHSGIDFPSGIPVGCERVEIDLK